MLEIQPGEFLAFKADALKKGGDPISSIDIGASGDDC